MVCKEDVLSWFKDLESYRRIDVMYELLNMCVPFEVRFLGTCVEEIGKHSYQELRGPAIVANDVDRLTKDGGLTRGLLDEQARHRALLYVSLLGTRNCECANWFYRKLFRTDWLEDCVVNGNVKDESAQSELLLLFTLGLHHPAFTFEQKLYFGRVLSLLMECRDSRVTVKPTVFYPSHPPGIGGYPAQKSANVPDVPVKVALPLPPPPPSADNSTVMQHGHPPGLPVPAMPPSPLELLAASLWNRPGFAGTVCGAPAEVPPFPQPPISPLVSRTSSPIHSRSGSPHRTAVGPPPQIDPIVALPARQVFNSECRLSDEEDKWTTVIPLPLDTKPLNGMRFGPYVKPQQQQPFILDHMQALSLDGGDNPCSSGGGSANSSPAETPTTPHHGPGRGGGDSAKQPPRLNGVPPPFQPQPPICDATPPPPPLPALANCSVPYSYPTHVPLPSRSLFQYAPPAAYRAPFTATPAPPYAPYQPSDNSPVYSTFTVPYHLSYMYSSAGQQQQQPPRPTNCYNCGATGHAGPDCAGQTIEDITQKRTYQLEYASPPPPDVDK